MAGRSQRHMREFYGHYTTDASGQAAPRQVTTITDPGTGVAVNEDFSSFFHGYPRAYSGTNLPDAVTIDADTGVATGSAAADTYTDVSITVTNAFGEVTSNTFTWTVS